MIPSPVFEKGEIYRIMHTGMIPLPESVATGVVSKEDMIADIQTQLLLKCNQ